MFEEQVVEHLLAAVAGHDFTASDAVASADRIDAIVALDRVIAAAQARQYEQIAALEKARRAMHRIEAHGDLALSIIGELSLARNISPGAAGTQYGNAAALATLPSVAGALEDGVITDATARAICREATSLHNDDRVLLDAEIAPRLPGLTSGRAARLAQHLVVGIDTEAARQRAERNRTSQHVSLMPDVDGVAMMNVRGPAELVVAAHRSLETFARAQRAAGDPREVGQIMCQTLVERVTGRSVPDGIDVEIGIVVSAETLVGADSEPVELVGYGPIEPGLLDDIVDRAGRAFYRRLVTDPITDVLVARDPRRRRFDGALGGHLRTRDRWCRQPGCDGRTQHLDHVQAWAEGGPTVVANGQGLCTRSHTFKHLPGWRVRTRGTDIEWTTPTGHTYTSPTPTIGYRRRE